MIGAKCSARCDGRPSSSRAWTWTIAAPCARQRSTSSRISSVEIGTCGVISFVGTMPVGATLMISASAAIRA